MGAAAVPRTFSPATAKSVHKGKKKRDSGECLLVAQPGRGHATITGESW
jgi:hypothetical protein